MLIVTAASSLNHPLPHHPPPHHQDYTKEERQQLAAKSRLAAPKVASQARQRLVDGLHARMLELEARPAARGDGEAPGVALARLRAEVEAAHGGGSSSGGAAAGERDDAPLQRASDAVQSPLSEISAVTVAAVNSDTASPASPAARAQSPAAATDAVATSSWPGGDQHAPATTSTLRRRPAVAVAVGAASSSAGSSAGGSVVSPSALSPASSGRVTPEQLRLQRQQEHAAADRGLTLLAVLLSIAIAMMLLRKIAAVLGGGGRVDAFMHSA